MKKTNKRLTNYECWIWIELIGFDNTQPDFGVREYLEKLGFVPESLSFLITSPDIVHRHGGLTREIIFPPDWCSYYGHPCNAEREVQNWTNYQLRDLIHTLQAHGVKVFLSTFTTFLGHRFSREWIGEHQELLEVLKNGKLNNALLPLKCFKDGKYYEYFFIPQLVRVMQDYRFDGWHAADGWGPARLPLNEADFSTDMIDQFSWNKQIAIPSNLENKADWIWKNHRLEWIDFYTDRWAAFYQKQAAALHAINKQVVINSAWTRDPFEAIYRYGIDYRKIIAAGVDGIVTESAAAASDMEAGSGSRLYNYTAALMLIRAFVPHTKVLFLNGVKDTTEQWDVIRHAPTVYESEIFTLSNTYFQTGHQLKRCADGFVVCLGDGIRSEEWRWLERRWELAFGDNPNQLIGATLVCSDQALDQELADFCEHRNWSTHHLLYTLLEHGAPIHSAVRIDDVKNATGTLLLLNSHLFPPQELEEVLLHSPCPVILIGRNTNNELNCTIHGAEFDSANFIQSTKLKNCFENMSAVTEPITFLENLPMQEVAEEFIESCARLITRISDAPVVVRGENFIQVQTMKLDKYKLRLIIKNNQQAYARPIIDVGQPIKSITILTEFPCARIDPKGAQFSIKIPGRGAVITEVLLKDDIE